MKAKLLAVVGLALLGAGSSASAAIVDVTYTGTVDSSYDHTAVFGISDPGGFYIGDTIVANFIFNTSLGNALPGNANSAVGGTFFSPSVTNPGLTASVTLNGHTVSITPDLYSEIYGLNSGASSEQLQQVKGASGFPSLLADIEASDGSIPASITTSLTYNLATDPTATGLIEFEVPSTQIMAMPTSLEVTVTATPLPSAWTMLTAGLVAFGFFAYRGTKRTAAAVAST